MSLRDELDGLAAKAKADYTPDEKRRWPKSDWDEMYAPVSVFEFTDALEEAWQRGDLIPRDEVAELTLRANQTEADYQSCERARAMLNQTIDSLLDDFRELWEAAEWASRALEATDVPFYDQQSCDELRAAVEKLRPRMEGK